MAIALNFDTFLKQKNDLSWSRLTTWQAGVGSVRHLVWKGHLTFQGKVNGIPSYFAYITINDATGLIGVSLAINVKFDIRGRGQKVIDQFTVGKRDEVTDEMLIDILNQRYGVTENLDFSKTPIGWEYKYKKYDFNDLNTLLARKTLYNQSEEKIAVIILQKVVNYKKQIGYEVSALSVPAKDGLHEELVVKDPLIFDIREANAHWQRLIRLFKAEGYSEEVFIPNGANAENWDFDLGISKADANKFKRDLEEQQKQYDPDFENIASTSLFISKIAQANNLISQYYQGEIPEASKLQSFVGTPSVEASQIKGIFNGVDEAISLVNQFDSSLLVNVAFIYNFSGGGAYGVYIAALDEQIKNAELKNLLKKDGYDVEDMPDGSFYASHKEKSKEDIDRQITMYRQKIDQTGASTFGIDMNKVIGAARADANEAGITDSNDQRILGVLHLGATMVHEAVHAKGSTSEGPSEQAEAKFMAWAMPIINEQRRKAYETKNKTEEYSPLIVNPSQRRIGSASNWMERAEAEGVVKTAQYGAQFLHNQNFVNRFGPAPWSAAYWTYGNGAIESMLGQARPLPKPKSELSFEGQLRNQNKNKWTSFVDTGSIAEELLEPLRSPLDAYKTTETLMEDGRVKPLMLPISSKKSIRRKASYSSYDPNIDTFGYMNNLDLPMEDRVQEFDENDEETTHFSKKFIANQTRYNPEYGNPLSKEDDIYMWWVEPNSGPTLMNDPSEEHPSLKTSPWQRVAASTSEFTKLFDVVVKNIENSQIKGTRFTCSKNYIELIQEYFNEKDNIRVDLYEEPDGLIIVWVVENQIPTQMVSFAESYVQGNSEDDNAKKAFDEITAIPKIKEEAVAIMINKVETAAKEAGKNLFILGDFPLAVKTNVKLDNVRTIDFCSEDPDFCIKVGEIISESLLFSNSYMNDDDDSFIVKWKCMCFRFRGLHLFEDIKNRLLTPLMLAFDITTKKVLDLTGEAFPDVEARVVRTEMSSEKAIAINPLIIFDSIFLASVFDFVIDSEFTEAATKSECDNQDLQWIWFTIRASGKGKCRAIAEEYGMEDTLSQLMGEKNAYANSTSWRTI